MFEQSIDTFVLFVQEYRMWGYALLFIVMILEGELFLIMAGMLASLDALSIEHVLWIALTGVVIGNTLYYQLGVMLKNGGFAKKIIKWAEGVIIYFLPQFREKPFKSIFISKFIYGANRATVIMSGVLHVPFRLFFQAELMASVFWVLLYASVGYFFGYMAIDATHNASRFILRAAIFVVAFILIQKSIVNYYERRKHKKLEDSNA